MSLIWLFQASSETEKPYGDFFARLKASGRPTREIAAKLIGLAVTTVPLYAKAVAQIVDLYMSDERVAERTEIIRLAQHENGLGLDAGLLKGFVREGMSELIHPQQKDRC